MTKRILFFTVFAVILYIVSYQTNSYVLASKDISTSFSLHSVYLFHLVAALVVYVLVEIVAEKLPTQAGYTYLASIFLKLGLFVLIFQDSIFSDNNLTRPERISLVIPLFLFLITEAVGVSKLLNSK